MAIRAGASTELYDLQNDPRRSTTSRTASPRSPRRWRRASRFTRAPRAGGARITARPRSGCARSDTSPAPRSRTRRAHQIPPRRSRLERVRGCAAALNAHRPDAVRALEDAGRTQPGRDGVPDTYARALKDTGQLQAALAVYRQAARRWPTDATLLHDLAVAARDAADERRRHGGAPCARKRPRRTSGDRARAEERDGAQRPRPDRGRRGPAAARRRRSNRRPAIDPTNAPYWANLGNARRALSDRAGAEQAYRRALDVDARAADAANGLGVLLVEAKRPAEAMPWFERASPPRPTSSRRG